MVLTYVQNLTSTPLDSEACRLRRGRRCYISGAGRLGQLRPVCIGAAAKGHDNKACSSVGDVVVLVVIE